MSQTQRPSWGTILVAGADVEKVRLACATLTRAGFRCLTVAGYGEALELAEAERPELIVADADPPGQGAAELFRRVRAVENLEARPLNVPDSRPEAAEGDDDYLAVPVETLALGAEAGRMTARAHGVGPGDIGSYELTLGRIGQLAQKLGEARDLEAVFEALLAFIRASAPCDGGLISLYDEALNVRTPGYAWLEGRRIDVSGYAPSPVGDGFAGRVIKTQTAAVTGDYQRELAGHLVCHIDPGGQGRVPHSALVAPMIVKGRTVGTVEIQSYERDAYRREHEVTVQMAANLAANAIESVRLLEQECAKEEQLRQSQKMEAVGRLAGGVAHDFNNLLTAINGYSDLALRRLGPGDPRRHNITEIKGAGERAASLTRQLLAFSRKQVLQPRVLDLNDVISDAYKIIRRLIGEDIEVVLALGDGLWKTRVDPGQIDQVLMNLAVNARDAMPFGGRLEIRTANVEMDPEIARRYASVRPGPHVLLSVSDTGQGMDEETRRRAFEPFFTTKEVGKGTGLGLSTVYGIVKQSGGYVAIESEVGRGTSFSIYLPGIPRPEDAPGADAHAPASGGREVVLVVEDEDAVRGLTRTILEESGYSMLEARGGTEALGICGSHDGPIHLLLTDVIMPGMSGRHLADRAVGLRPEMRVLYMSGYTDDAIVHHGVLDEGTPFLQKPYSPDGLALKVREVLDAPARTEHSPAGGACAPRARDSEGGPRRREGEGGRQ